MNLYRIVNIVYRTLWLILIILIFTFDRSSNNSVYILGLLVILTIVAIVRAINSRNEWRPIAEKHYFENMTEETSKDN